ncbi:MAG: hypothetical protein ACI4V3_08505, partial [Faecousia sp.]
NLQLFHLFYGLTSLTNEQNVCSEKISSVLTKNSRRAGQYELRTGKKYAMMQKKKKPLATL